jgi:hypothetical protein
MRSRGLTLTCGVAATVFLLSASVMTSQQPFGVAGQGGEVITDLESYVVLLSLIQPVMLEQRDGQ